MGKEFSELPVAISVASNDEFAVVQSGLTKRVSQETLFESVETVAENAAQEVATSLIAITSAGLQAQINDFDPDAINAAITSVQAMVSKTSVALREDVVSLRDAISATNAALTSVQAMVSKTSVALREDVVSLRDSLSVTNVALTSVQAMVSKTSVALQGEISVFSTSAGAALIGVNDSNDYFDDQDVEAVLEETGARFAMLASVYVAPPTGGETAAQTLARLEAAVTELSSGGVVQLGEGTYDLEDPWVIEQSNLFVRGVGRGRTLIRNNSLTQNCVVFQPSTAGTTSANLSSCGISHLSIGIAGSSPQTAGVGLWVRQCSSFTGEYIVVSDHFNNIVTTGGQLNFFDHFYCFHTKGTPGSPAAGSAGVVTEAATITGPTYINCFTTVFSNFVISGSDKLCDNLIEINSADGITFDNGYLHLAEKAYVHIEKNASGQYVAGVMFSNVYFDGSDSAESGGVSPNYLVHIPDSGIGTNSASEIHFSQCLFMNMFGENASFQVSQGVAGLHFTGCTFNRNDSELLRIDETDGGIYTISGGSVDNGGTTSTSSAVYIKGAAELTIVGVTFGGGNEEDHIKLDGTIGRVAIVGNTFRLTTTDVDISGATIVHPSSIFANSSQATTPTWLLPDSALDYARGPQVVQMYGGNFVDDLSTGDGKDYFPVPAILDGMNLTGVHARCITAPTGATISIQIHNASSGQDMLSTPLTIDAGEVSSHTAATPAVIDTAEDDVIENNYLRLDIDQVGSSTAGVGLIVTLVFEAP